MRAYRKLRDGAVTSIGRQIAARDARAPSIAGQRSYPPDGSQPFGYRFAAGRERERGVVVASVLRAIHHVATTTTTSSTASARPAWVGALYLIRASTTPMTTPAIRARGNDTIRASSAAASTRLNVLGPMVPSPVTDARGAGQQDERHRGEARRRSSTPASTAASG